MAGRFSQDQWDQIEARLATNPAAFGMPDGGREESVVLASLNIRKLSRFEGRQRELKFMARFCARCDLIAIQEVQDDLSGLRYLQEQMDKRVSSIGEYGLVVSDITGKVPGEGGMQERLAFLYRKNRVRPLELTSDLTVDRTGVLRRLKDSQTNLKAAIDEYEEKLKKHKQGKLPPKPKFVLPDFLTFARTPHVTAFEIPAAGTSDPVAFIAVNAHLIYGKMKERKAEFRELARWMALRIKAFNKEKKKNVVARNFILLGDLNMDLDNLKTGSPANDRVKVEKFIGELKKEVYGDAKAKRIYFPFIGNHPVTKRPIRSNARHNQTFDQIGFFLGNNEGKLPMLGWASKITNGGADEFDYGVFDFAELFANTILNKSYEKLSEAGKDKIGVHFENSVSDHMPIWVRIPRPGF